MPGTATLPAPPATSTRDVQKPPTRRDHGGGSSLERVTVNLIPRASNALQRASDITGDSKTDSINRALELYAFLQEVIGQGGVIYVRESNDSDLMRLKIL